MAETSLTVRWRALGGREEMLAEVRTGAGNVKSESLDEASELSEVSKELSRTMGWEVDVEFDGERKIFFSCENWSDIQNNSLGHRKIRTSIS